MALKVAVVGTGKVAVQNYLPYLVQHKDVTLSYYNRTRVKAEDAARRFGGKVADSLAELMADQPDTVLVLTRETDRHEAARALLEFRPKRLFFEKPLVARFGQANVVEEDFIEAREILQQAQAAGTETAMVFNYRFFDQTCKARELITTHNLGRPVHFTGLVHYACWSHCIDLILDFAGPAHTISALASRQQQSCMGSTAVTEVAAAVHMENDATGTIIGTCRMDFKLPLYELTFAFERGRISMRDLDGDMEMVDYATGRHVVHALSRDVSRWDQYRASFGKAINAYLASIREDASPPVPGVAGLRELQFEAAIKHSIREARPVILDTAFPIGL